MLIQAWRHPTKAEIKFGYGAIHYAKFERELWLRKDGTLKKWIICDGLKYNRY